MRLFNFSETSSRILKEIILGILLFAVVGTLIILAAPVEKLPALLGFWLGAFLNICSMIHITYVTEMIVDMHDQRHATRYSIINYLARLLIMGIAIVFSYYTRYLNMLTLVIGLFGIKAGAYLQPFMRRFLERHAKR